MSPPISAGNPLGWLVYAAWYFFPAMLINLSLYLCWLSFGRDDGILPFDLRHQNGSGRWIGDGRGFASIPWTLAVAGLCSCLQHRGAETLVLVAGAQFGMIASSFLKRRLSLARGAPWRPWEHIDYVVGAILFRALEPGGIPVPLAVAGVLTCGFFHVVLGGLIKWLLAGRKEPRP